jgi:aromatic-amino-acid transaminase
MFETLKPAAPDKIIELMGLYRADPRGDKVDLGVGVYKDAEGHTPVMRAVKAAEARLIEEQRSKAYVGVLGDLEFVDALGKLALGAAAPRDRLAGAQTPGGTGAIRQLFELVRRAAPAATVWHSEPSWPNHPAILGYLGIPARTYRYFDAATRGVDFAGMMADLKEMKPGDVLLLHGCCHNPTGADLSDDQWREVTEFVLASRVVPLIDLAYQGFGDGLEPDAAGLRHMAAEVPELMLAVSCSKNFGLYRDRVGAAFVLSPDKAASEVTRSNLFSLNRLNFSFPPDHGAKVVAMILGDAELKADWMAELENMRLRMLDLRRGLAEALRRETNSDRFDFVAEHRGMFSRLGASPEQVKALRDEHGIYMVGDSRVNVAGLPANGLDELARALVAVGA